MYSQLTLDEAQREKAQAMDAVERNAGVVFREEAKAFVLEYLARHGEQSGETLTNACLKAGIVPHDDRAFGPVLMSLSRNGLIEKCGMAVRQKGHGTSGGNIWKLVPA